MTEFLKSPHHLLHTRWHGLDDENGYDSIEVDITIDVDPGEKSFYYYACDVFFPVFHEDENGHFFGLAYAGLQTNGSVDHEGSERVGRMAIFSVWGGTGGIPEDDGWGLVVPEDGNPYSVRRRFHWQEGVPYRLRFSLEDGDDDTRIMSASLTDLHDGAVTRIGRIYVPANYGGIRQPETFHERYDRSAEVFEDIEASQVTFANVTSNDGLVRAGSWENTGVFSKFFYRDRLWHEACEGGLRTGAGLKRPS